MSGANGIVNHYATLGLIKEAPQPVVRAAWKALVAEYHPDRDSSEGASIKLRRVNEAFTVLGTPKMRAAYDRTIAADEERAVALTVRGKVTTTPAARNRDARVGALLVLAVGFLTFGVGLREIAGLRSAPIDALGSSARADRNSQPMLTKGLRLYSIVEASLKHRDTAARSKQGGEAEIRPGMAQGALSSRPFGLSLR